MPQKAKLIIQDLCLLAMIIVLAGYAQFSQVV